LVSIFNEKINNSIYDLLSTTAFFKW